MRCVVPLLLSVWLAAVGPAAEYLVAVDGDDGQPGTVEQPFRTIQRAADVMQPGDTCYVRGGTYRETVTIERGGSAEEPVRFIAYPGETAVLDGTEPVNGPWQPHPDSILRTKTDLRFEQLFVNRQMMLEARWPNTTFDRLLSREGWATTGPESGYERLHDPELAETGLDWTGATAILNVAHQFWTWSRPVLNHTRGGDTFEYRIKMNEFHSKRTHWWGDDCYYLMGHPEALDAPTEWFLAEDGTLYLWPPEGVSPDSMTVETKARDYGFVGAGMRHVTISGFHFFGCTFSFEDADHCTVEYCNLLFPSFARGVPDAEEPPRRSAGTRLTGQDNVVRSCALTHCGNFGIQVRGARNVVENCLIHDVNWSGTLRHTAISLAGSRDDERPANVARYNTAYNVGNTIINSGGNRHGVIAHNHVHHGGLLSKDVSLIYTSMPQAMGLEIRYNWVHDSLSPSNSLGIRGDDKTRGVRIHHNVVWNVRRDGVVVKGGLNRVYNNTCFGNGAADILFLSGREPDKWWQEHVPAYEHQNEDSLLVNNCANVICSTRSKVDPGLPGDNSHNHLGGALGLVDPLDLDFRPGPDSPLVDAGREVEGVTAPFEGAAPDIGAYERGGELWLPGHHNGVCVSRAENGALQVALNLPIAEAILTKVEADGREIAALRFTPGDWLRSQALPEGASGTLRFRTAEWGAAVVRDADSVRPLAAGRADFERPDLSSAKEARAIFDYDEVYQPEPLGLKPIIYARRPSGPVVIDGRLTADEWHGMDAGQAILLTAIEPEAENAAPAGAALVMADDEALYVGVRVERLPGAALPTEPTEWGQDDGVEVDFQTVAQRQPGPTFVLHGFPTSRMESRTDAGATEEEAQRLGIAIGYAAAVTDDSWTAEFRIPFMPMGLEPDEIDQLRFNIGARRNGSTPGPWYALAPTGGANYDVAKAASLRLRSAVPAEAPNRLQNGSFEADDLSPWQLTTNSAEPVPADTVERVQEARDAGWCVRLQSSDAEMMANRVLKWTHPIGGIMEAGTYLLSYDVRVEDLAPRGQMGSFNSYLHIRRDDRPGGNIGQQESLIEVRSGPWTRREFVLVVPEAVEPTMVSLQLHRATGTVWIDNVSLVRCEP